MESPTKNSHILVTQIIIAWTFREEFECCPLGFWDRIVKMQKFPDYVGIAFDYPEQTTNTYIHTYILQTDTELS